MSNNYNLEYFNLFFFLIAKTVQLFAGRICPEDRSSLCPIDLLRWTKERGKYYMLFFYTLVPQHSSQEFTFYISFCLIFRHLTCFILVFSFTRPVCCSRNFVWSWMLFLIFTLLQSLYASHLVSWLLNTVIINQLAGVFIIWCLNFYRLLRKCLYKQTSLPLPWKR